MQVLEDGGELVRIQFLTLPRDQYAAPLAGQAVEILPWGALLPNHEKVAEARGYLATVATSFDPEDQSLTIARPVPASWLQWLADHPEYRRDRDPAGQRQYFYLRLWTGGSEDDDQPDHPFTPGTAFELPGTGLELTWNDVGLPGDTWIVAARPHTPLEVVPWELLEAAPPVGPRFFFAPLALVRWTADPNQGVVADVHDCRARFRPLCQLRGCCTLTVGDGINSHGDFDDIQAAVDHLPFAGGEICVLPGQHRANVLIAGRRNVTLHGCGKQSRVVPEVGRQGDPIFHVVDSVCVTLKEMDLVALGGTAVVAESTEEGVLQELEIAHNRILACDNAVRIEGGVDVAIHHNRIRMLDKEGAGVAIFVLADDGLVERNDVGVVPADTPPPPDFPEDNPDPVDPCEDPEVVLADPVFVGVYVDWVFGILVALPPPAPFRALGGIQIGGGSERVKVLENKIHGGAGNGVTLGGRPPLPGEPDEPEEPQEPAQLVEHPGPGIIQGTVLLDGQPLSGAVVTFVRTDNGQAQQIASNEDGTFILQAAPGEYAVSVAGHEIESITAVVEGPDLFLTITVRRAEERPRPALAFLYEIQIDRNEIENMGLSGIGMPLPPAPEPVPGTSVPTRGLEALGNPIETLGIHRNLITRCLQNPFDVELRAAAQDRGFGGISLGICANVTISGNRIEGNGRRHVDPVCGIWITLGEVVDVHHNHLRDNGRIVAADVDLDSGRRGGIVMTAASFGLDDLLLAAVIRDRNLDTGRAAARIHDNLVEQPAGQALRLFAFGPAAVGDNRFATELTGPAPLERLAGTVLILNAGGAGRLPAGTTSFHDNQVRLGPGAGSSASQVIWTLDDLGYDANQSRDLAGLQGALALNAMLLGVTLRATGNRFQEPPNTAQAPYISLISATNLMNNTSLNQGDHCIFAFGNPEVEIGNQVLFNQFCQQLSTPVGAASTGFANARYTTGPTP